MPSTSRSPSHHCASAVNEVVSEHTRERAHVASAGDGSTLWERSGRRSATSVQMRRHSLVASRTPLQKPCLQAPHTNHERRPIYQAPRQAAYTVVWIPTSCRARTHRSPINDKVVVQPCRGGVGGEGHTHGCTRATHGRTLLATSCMSATARWSSDTDGEVEYIPSRMVSASDVMMAFPSSSGAAHTTTAVSGVASQQAPRPATSNLPRS